jgi:hypothetical protein
MTIMLGMKLLGKWIFQSKKMGVITRGSSTSSFEVKIESLAAAVKLVKLICGLAGLASNLLLWYKMMMLGFNQDINWI